MKIHYRLAGVLASVLGTVALAVCPSQAGASVTPHSLIWEGNPAQGTSVFGLLNCAAPGTITVAHDATKGAVWDFTKPAGDKRCEVHGIALNGTKYNFQNNSTYYFGWWSKLSSTVDDYANFQWKSYGTGMTQNYPFVISMHSGRTSIWQFQPGVAGKEVWASPSVTANTWMHYVVGVHTSSDLTGGWIQLWFNGSAQKFVNGSSQYACRTWDVSDDPKWGVYGATATNFSNEVAAPKMGTSYADVAN
jgi:hypothetical protein